MDIDIFIELLAEDVIKNFDKLKIEIDKNAAVIVAYLRDEEKSQLILSDDRKLVAALDLISHYIKSSKEDNSEFFASLVEKYANPRVVNGFKNFTHVSRELFYMINKYGKYQLGLSFYGRICQILTKTQFTSIMAYAVYFAYQLKNYEYVENILNSFFVELRSEHYNDGYDFTMFNFYRGLIYLSKKDYYKGSICFVSIFKSHFAPNVVTYFQIEALKRLVFLFTLVDPIYKSQINQIIRENKRLFSIKPLEIYSEANKLFSDKISLKDIEKWTKETASKLKSDKVHGLVKIAIRKTVLNKIAEVMKSYRRIKGDKLANIVEVDKNVLVSLLKTFTYNNQINVQYDEVEDIVQVFNSDFNESKSIEEIKSTYKNIISIEQELIDVNFRKAELLEKFKRRVEKENSFMSSQYRGNFNINTVMDF